ncbi:MAG: hypothetical protein FJ149_10380 [Euryarchaeota archaeon]|nr:hypothetical protein [Euryarchaeota archaeon]
MGPGFANGTRLPAFVEVPEGYGAVVVNGTIRGRQYEPFTPASYYQIGRVDITVNRTATYYIAVFEPDRGGDFGIAIGYLESFTAGEWLLIPFSVIEIRLWEGQPLALVLAPLALSLGAGTATVAYLGRRKGRWPFPPAFWPGTAAALMLVGTGAMTVMQMGIALAASENPAGGAVTALFAAIPLALGAWALRLAWGGEHGRGARLRMAMVGAFGLVFWGGLIIGPALAFVWAALPGRVFGRYHES